MGLGVIPVAVTNLKAGAVRTVVRRLSLSFPVIPDPRAIAASQFNSLDPATLQPVPAWFVVDRSGRVRGLRRGSIPAARWADVAANALALPSPRTMRPAAKTR